MTEQLKQAAQATSASEKHVSVNVLSNMVKPLDGLDRNHPGFHEAMGWNAALRQAMDYARPAAQATPSPQQAAGGPVGEPFVATYSSESIGGKQHDTGRVNKGPRGGFFASTASPEDARLIADALNAYTHPAPGVPDVEDLRDRLVAISAAVADCDDRAAQSMLSEILRMLAAAQAKGGEHA